MLHAAPGFSIFLTQYKKFTRNNFRAKMLSSQRQEKNNYWTLGLN